MPPLLALCVLRNTLISIDFSLLSCRVGGLLRGTVVSCVSQVYHPVFALPGDHHHSFVDGFCKKVCPGTNDACVDSCLDVGR